MSLIKNYSGIIIPYGQTGALKETELKSNTILTPLGGIQTNDIQSNNVNSNINKTKNYNVTEQQQTQIIIKGGKIQINVFDKTTPVFFLSGKEDGKNTLYYEDTISPFYTKAQYSPYKIDRSDFNYNYLLADNVVPTTTIARFKFASGAIPKFYGRFYNNTGTVDGEFAPNKEAVFTYDKNSTTHTFSFSYFFTDLKITEDFGNKNFVPSKWEKIQINFVLTRKSSNDYKLEVNLEQGMS